jgi:pilus assembly protein Flp/PilA
MRLLPPCVRHFLVCEDGHSAKEYAAMMSRIILTCMATIKSLSNQSAATFNAVGSQLGKSAGS